MKELFDRFTTRLGEINRIDRFTTRLGEIKNIFYAAWEPHGGCLLFHGLINKRAV